jgi:uncharacterized protein affecting Mg2+/Co2+ transport
MHAVVAVRERHIARARARPCRTVLNHSSQEAVQLLTRHWLITDAKGEIVEVGPGAHGVLGEQPVIQPGRAVRYMSSVPLKTTFGTMEGSFEMAVVRRQQRSTVCPHPRTPPGG